MSEAITTPEKIWIITGETQTPKTSPEQDNATKSITSDTGGILGDEPAEVTENIESESKRQG
ncbi:MAG: hypothetical protein AB4372_13450 [Xenococcus sp. (in: cyanobacteria)]